MPPNLDPLKANPSSFVSVSDCDDDEEEDSSEVGSESRDKVGKLGGRLCQFEEEETRSRFTEYSMTSSVMRRNQQLSLLDHRFEKVHTLQSLSIHLAYVKIH